MIVSLCGSCMYTDKIINFADQLEIQLKAHVAESIVNLPNLMMVDNSKFTKEECQKIYYGLMREHFDRMDKSDIVVFCNFDGYYGTAVTEELTYCFAKGIRTISLYKDFNTEEFTRDNMVDYIVNDKDYKPVACKEVAYLCKEIMDR